MKWSKISDSDCFSINLYFHNEHIIQRIIEIYHTSADKKETKQFHSQLHQPAVKEKECRKN